MKTVTGSIGLFLFSTIASATVPDAAAPYIGVYRPWSRGCGGAVFLRAKTVEWHATWNSCKRSPYKVLDVAEKNELPRIAVKIEKPSKHCGFEVLEIQQETREPPSMWALRAYPTLESYKKRDLPDWQDSPLPERAVPMCPLDPRPDPRR
ncbi:hypothetical protein [Variovorax sp. YR216]|uniref:hypothetical protein n=1 Tax=Variovorax sp. YR216 TaxID=1882828 RepID=UPI00089948F5|nr:hypothetical protein [Variovorax sp. YR216]SEA17099.1 hypothetical protein SAMN05444680_101765 [Variovorax sp. YR216]